MSCYVIHVYIKLLLRTIDLNLPCTCGAISSVFVVIIDYYITSLVTPLGIDE